jgi:hypothetical protein
VRLRDGRTLAEAANGARGYPANPASDADLTAKFLACATRAISPPAAEQALSLLRRLEQLDDVRAVTTICRPDR